MIQHYFKTALHNLWKHKTISSIKILSLVIGLACALIILFWIQDQLSVDQDLANRKDIYRLQENTSCGMPAFSTQVMENLSAIQTMARMEWKRPQLLFHKDQPHLVEDLIFADQAIFSLFSYNWIKGHPDHAFPTPFSIVLTEDLAGELFGEEDPIGQILVDAENHTFTVTGVISKPENRHLNISALANFECLPILQNNPNYFMEDRWSYLVYCQLVPGADPEILSTEITNRLQNEYERIIGDSQFNLFPYGSVYFATDLTNERGVRHGNQKLLLVFGLIGLATLIIASINFINLSIAHSSVRKKEISIRKVVGAQKGALSWQFMWECFLVAFISLPFTLLLVELMLPTFNLITGNHIDIRYGSPLVLLSILGILVFTTLIAGLAPSLFMASFNPLTLMRGSLVQRGIKSPFRNLMLILQFSMAVILIMGSIIVIKQSRFMHQTHLGFDPENIIHLNTHSNFDASRFEPFKQELLAYPHIKHISLSQSTLGSIQNTNTWKVRGADKPMEVILADPAFIPLMDIELVSGRNFYEDQPADRHKKLIINEEAVGYLGFENPIGQTVLANGRQAEIIGIVKDFHYNSLHHRIEPMAICWEEQWSKVINIKINGDDIETALKRIHEAWDQFYPQSVFSYAYLDDTFASDYYTEKRLIRLLLYFTLTILFLAGIGLFGMSLFMIRRRTREIAVRKVFGASVSHITGIFIRLFTRILAISLIIAWPVGYIATRQWLHGFVYQTDIGITVFLLSGLFALLIAWISVSLHIYQAGRLNVIQALKYE